MPTLQPSLSLADGNSNNHVASSTVMKPANPSAHNSDGLADIHLAFKGFVGGPKLLNSRAAARNIIADHHPNHHVTNVYQYDFNLSSFVDAGFATADREYADNCYDVGREYKPPYGGRTFGNEPRITEKVYWMRSRLNWQSSEYLWYRISWKMEYDQEVEWQFLLYPRASDDSSPGKCQRIDDLLLAVGKFSEKPHEDIFVFEDKWTYRDEDMYRAIKDVSWDDVIIDPAVKEAIMRDILSFFEPATKELYIKYNLPYKRGVILHGSPGNGKTITIKALINHLQHMAEPVPTLYVKSMKDKCKGDQEPLKELFKEARRRAPILLVLEDLDSLVHEDVRSQFLNELDGLQGMNGILILGSTNHFNNIDSAITSRPSRFDRKYAFALPDHAGRVRYARHWREKLAGNADVDFAEPICELVADLTEGFSFAYLKELFISSLLVVSRVVPEADTTLGELQDANGTSTETKKNKTSDLKTEPSAEKEQSNPRQLPRIDVPAALKDNAFLPVLQRQAGLLIKDMNDAAAKEEADKKKDEVGDDKDKKPVSSGCTVC